MCSSAACEQCVTLVSTRIALTIFGYNHVHNVQE